MADSVVVHGLERLKAQLAALPIEMRKRVLRNALAAGARVVQRDAKGRAPLLSAGSKAPYRKPGTVRDAIRVRTSKAARRSGDVGVFINVKPAPGAQRGAKSRTDPFYWRWLEFGTRKMASRSFLRPAADRLTESLKVFESTLGRWVDRVNASGKVQP